MADYNPSSDSQEAALNLLFDPDEVIGFREPAPTHRSTYGIPGQRSEFFCINPLMAQAPMTLDNIACYRNILVECDEFSIESQFEYIGQKLRLPYMTCTFSGKKSLHFIIRLSDPCKDELIYNELARMVFAVVKRCDPVNINPNRLSRLPEALRRLPNDGEWVVQSLITARRGASVSQEALINWAQKADAVAYNSWLIAERDLKEAVLANVQHNNEELQPLSATSQQLVYHGAVAPGRGRHEALQKLASELLFKNYNLYQIETYLYQAQDAIGLTERDDVPGLMRWAQRKA